MTDWTDIDTGANPFAMQEKAGRRRFGAGGTWLPGAAPKEVHDGDTFMRRVPLQFDNPVFFATLTACENALRATDPARPCMKNMTEFAGKAIAAMTGAELAAAFVAYAIDTCTAAGMPAVAD